VYKRQAYNNSGLTVTGTTGPGTVTVNVTYQVNAVFSNPTALSSWDSANPVTGLTAPADVTFNYTLNWGWAVVGASTTTGAVSTFSDTSTYVACTPGPGTVTINVAHVAGQIRAFIEPPGAIVDGAQWRIVGTGGWRSAGAIVDVLVGTYTVEFKGISGWATPSSRAVVVFANERAETTGVYEANPTGSLQVFIDPEDEVIPDGAMWRPAGSGTWLESGDIVHGLSPGPIGIQFKVAPGWILPDLQGSRIRANVVTRETGEYVRPLIIHFNDYNGNGTEDLAVFNGRSGVWSVAEAGLVGSAPAAAVFLERKFGKSDDIAAPGDYDGDGIADLAIYRESTGMYRVDGQFNLRRFGEKRDIPVPGDYDGDGTTDPGLFRPTTGEWFIHGLFEAQSPADMITTIDFGEFGDVPVPGDYDGDGRTDLAIFDVVTGEWRVAVYDEAQGEWVEKPRLNRVYGSIGDIPIQADYDGDGRTDLAFWRRSDGSWNVRNQFELILGRRDDFPIPNDWANLGRDLPTIFRMRNGRWESAENLLKAKHGAGSTPLMSGR